MKALLIIIIWEKQKKEKEEGKKESGCPPPDMLGQSPPTFGIISRHCHSLWQKRTILIADSDLQSTPPWLSA